MHSYEGEWKDDNHHGFGKKSSKSGVKEHGTFHNGFLKHSTDSVEIQTKVFIKGEFAGKYQGQFKDFKKHGKGKMVYVNM